MTPDTADIYPEPLDADWDPKGPLVELMNMLPALSVDLPLFAKSAVWQGGPVRFEAALDPESVSKMRFWLWFSDRDGKRVGVTSKHLPRLLWQAAALDRQGLERQRKRYIGQMVDEEE